MYEWPETCDAISALWQAIRHELLASGIDAPLALEHPDDLYAAWQSPSLIIGQTCGLPLVRELRQQVCVLGTFDHHLRNTPAGDYHSVLIVNKSSQITELADLAHATVAVNSVDSQSGYAALLHHFAPLAKDGQFFNRVKISGSHRGSITAVATGAAQVAAIDAVSWELALDHESAALACRILLRTDPTPALPLITSAANTSHADALTAAISKAVAKLPESIAAALHIHGFERRCAGDYTVLSERLETAQELGYQIVR